MTRTANVDADLRWIREACDWLMWVAMASALVIWWHGGELTEACRAVAVAAFAPMPYVVIRAWRQTVREIGAGVTSSASGARGAQDGIRDQPIGRSSIWACPPSRVLPANDVRLYATRKAKNHD